ncbi:uncharacterized protein TNCV_3110981 [Trichonephila clavipes]|nr:uncharacterized protein TNCV_3110981 [Trichonephila clavipes]
MLPKELHQLKYEALSVPQGSVRLVKKTQERKSSTCYLLITKGVTKSSPVPLKTRRETGSITRFSAPYLETTILMVLLAWLVGGGVASLRQG